MDMPTSSHILFIPGVLLIGMFLGFILGVLRLSSSWLINRIVYCYVEFTRNVPVLVQILLWHGVIVSTLPAPRTALSPMEGVYLSNRGFYVPAIRPPTVAAGMARLRITLSALHTESQVEQLLDALAQVAA